MNPRHPRLAWIRPPRRGPALLLLPAVAAALALTALISGGGTVLGQNAQAPTVTAVAISSDAGDDDTYILGDTIRVTVTFSEAVDVTGTPRLSIDMDPADWGAKWAAYASGSGTTALVFAHEVVEPNFSTQGIAVLANTLELNGGTITSAASQTAAGLAHDGLDHDAEHRVDWTLSPPAPAAPTVTAVAVTSDAGDDDTYALGDTIQVTVTFSEAVDVTGTPRLSIDMDPADWGAKWAAYASGSGTTALVFAHEVVEPNHSTQGIAVLANTLELNGGAIRSVAAHTDAALAHDGLAHDAAHRVDWTLSPPAPAAPTVTAVAITSDAGDDDTYALGDTIQVTVTFSEAVDVTGTPQVAIDMDPADWGAKWAAYASGSGTTALVFAHTVVEPNFSTQGIAVLANTLRLNGGTITSAATQSAADFTHDGLAHDAAHLVDWQASAATDPECELTAPSSVSGTGSGAGAVVSWTLPEDLDGACRVTGFVVGAVSDAGTIEDWVNDPAARSHTMQWLPAGDYRFSVRIVYGEGDSEEIVTAQANSNIGACITLAVEPYTAEGYTGNAVAGTLTPVSGTGCATRTDFEIQMKRTDDDHWNSTGRFNAYWPQYRAGGPDRPDFILGSGEPYVSYDYKVIAYDKSTSNPGRYETNAVSVTIVSSDPSVSADANSPGNLRVRAHNNSDAVVTWDAPTVATGRTLSAYVVEWKTEAGAATTKVIASSESEFTSRRHRITGLTNGERYTVRVAARTHPSGDTSTTSDAWSVSSPYLTVWSEPTQVWFTGGTPSPNEGLGRVFMRAVSNKEGAFTCHVNADGTAAMINCPSDTLISLVNFGDAMTARAVFTLEGTTTTTDSSTHQGARGGPRAFAVYASASHNTLAVAWDGVDLTNAVHVGAIDAYIVQWKTSGATTWQEQVLADTDTRTWSQTLATGTWDVRVRARTDGNDGDDNTTDTARLGFTSEVLRVTIHHTRSQTFTPSDIRVTPGDSQSLVIEWDPDDEGAHPYGYQVRHKLTSAVDDPDDPNYMDPWTYSETIYARNVRRICDLNGCENPRSFEITGLTGGTEYDVEIRLNSANGWTGWVRAASSIKPND